MLKVLIRPLVEKDAQVSYKWRNDPDIWKYTGNRPNIRVTEEIEKKWILEKLKEKNSVRFAIIVDDEYVGNIQLTNIIENDTAEYHIFIGNKQFWGKGVAFFASKQLIQYTKDTLVLKKLYLNVNCNHNFAIKLYNKLGFKEKEKVDGLLYMELDLCSF